MITVQNLTKIYNQRKRHPCVALDDVSFSLPNRGMIFVLGKSGSGKSTLLNILGGLDQPTSGEIFIDGVAVSTFSVEDYDKYRNSHVGFVFQDFCLVDSLTVRQNVQLALELQSCDNQTRVEEILAQTDLTDFAERSPAELSGGQQQRVAIARAIVKNPKLVLADEPTGNLDSKTGQQILQLLKKLSQNSLVVVVSHNVRDAHDYADRIIEFSDGKILSDLSRNSQNDQSVAIEGDVVTFQSGTVFTEEQLGKINEKIRTSPNNVTLKQVDFAFVPSKGETEVSSDKLNLPKSKMSAKGCKTLFKSFTKRRIFGLAVTSLLVSLLIITLGVCQLFTRFDAGEQIRKALNESDEQVVVLHKGYTTNDIFRQARYDKVVQVTERDVAAFYDVGYNGNVYKLYNIDTITGEFMFDLSRYTAVFGAAKYQEFYSKSGLGVLQCDEKFLTDLYGVDGHLQVLSGNLYPEDSAIIVTDYFADSVLYHTPNLVSTSDDKYAKLTSGQTLFRRYKIAAVVKTDYQTKYQDVLELYRQMMAGELPFDQLKKDEKFLRFYNDLETFLNVGYTFSSDYSETLANDKTIHHEADRNWVYVPQGNVTLENHVYERINLEVDATTNVVLGNDECMPTVLLCCTMLGISPEEFSEDMVLGKQMSVVGANVGDSENFADYTLTITKVHPDYVYGVYVSDENFDAFWRNTRVPYALYLDDLSDVLAVYQVAEETNFRFCSGVFNAVYQVTQSAQVFVEFFAWIVVALVIVAGVALVSFVLGSIRKSMHEVGIVRAMGARSRDVAAVFVLQMLLLCVVVCAISAVGLIFGTGACNKLLVDSFVKIVGNNALSCLEIVSFSWAPVAVDLAVVVALAMATTLIPVLVLRKVEPKNIIKAKE